VPLVVSSPTPAIEVPLPQAGTGNVVGRILWNNRPVVGIEVQLCENFDWMGGCEGISFSTNTDDKGYYLFQNVTPGEYALAAHAIDKDSWLYVTAGLGFGAEKYTVTADKTLFIEEQSIYKFDLKLTYPAKNAEIDVAQPALTWDPYPDAAYYEVYLTSEKSGAIYVNERVDTNQITPSKPLLGCSYTWQVDAFNADGTKIAESDGYFHFDLVDQQVTCLVKIISPQDGASLSAANLTLTWEAHPMAAYYRVVVWDEDYNDLLGRARSDGTTYIVTQALGAGKYKWYVIAYDESDNQIAQSDFYEFTITGP
jgi:hypothetical protein